METKKIYVVDTSVTAKLFVVEDYREQAIQLYNQAIRKGITLLAPELTCYELNSVLSQAELSLEEVKKHWWRWVQSGVELRDEELDLMTRR